MNVVEFPKQNLTDIPLTLRNLADQIEKGEMGVAKNVVWILSTEDEVVTMGLSGVTHSPRETMYYLMGVAQSCLVE